MELVRRGRCRRRNLEIWVSGNLGIWKSWNLEIWKFGIKKQIHSFFLIRIRSVPNVGKFWISRKKLLTIFQTISDNFKQFQTISTTISLVSVSARGRGVRVEHIRNVRRACRRVPGACRSVRGACAERAGACAERAAHAPRGGFWRLLAASGGIR